MAKEAGVDYYVKVKRPLAVDLEVNVLQQTLAKEGRNPIIYRPEMRRGDASRSFGSQC